MPSLYLFFPRFLMHLPASSLLLASLPLHCCELGSLALTVDGRLWQVEIGSEPLTMFRDADWAVLLGAVPRAAGELPPHTASAPVIPLFACTCIPDDLCNQFV